MSGVSPLEDQLARLRHPEAPQRGRSGAVGDLGLRTQEEVTAVLASIEAGELCVDRVDNRQHNTAAVTLLCPDLGVGPGGGDLAGHPRGQAGQGGQVRSGGPRSGY